MHVCVRKHTRTYVWMGNAATGFWSNWKRGDGSHNLWRKLRQSAKFDHANKEDNFAWNQNFFRPAGHSPPSWGEWGGGAYRAKWRVKSDCLHSAPKRSDVSSLSMCLLVLGWRQRLRFNHYGIVCVFYRFFYVILRNV